MAPHSHWGEQGNTEARTRVSRKYFELGDVCFVGDELNFLPVYFSQIGKTLGNDFC
jgi:hypothetical protein